jgi:transposase
LSRKKLLEYLANRQQATIAMEACSAAHWLGRKCQEFGHEVALLPPDRVKPYVIGNKTDRADAQGILEAYRNKTIHRVPVKNEEQQAVMAIHRLRKGWLRSRTVRLNQLRAYLREFGIVIPLGRANVLPAVRERLEDLPARMRRVVELACEEIATLNETILTVDRELRQLARTLRNGRLLQSIPGIGPINATALIAEIGDPKRFPSGRHFASYLGLTPREHSSGEVRRLGRISKRGNPYLRTQLVHGARSVLWRAKHTESPPTILRKALQLQERRGHNIAVIALANKLARVIWKLWTQERHWQPEAPIA